jgi:hypothetical protein
MLKIRNVTQGSADGAMLTIPAGYDMVWIRVKNNQYDYFKFIFNDGIYENLGIFSCGNRNLNNLSPDGGNINIIY